MSCVEQGDDKQLPYKTEVGALTDTEQVTWYSAEDEGPILVVGLYSSPFILRKGDSEGKACILKALRSKDTVSEGYTQF